MKKIILLPMIMVLCFTAMISKAIDPTYSLTIKNISYKSNTTLEFDIYLLHTNSAATEFEYAGGQYFINFNPAILNGGTAKYQIVASDLPAGLRPVNPSIATYGSDAVLRLATNMPAYGTFVSHTGEGTLVGKMRLTSIGGTLNVKQNPNLSWRNEIDPRTKLAAFEEGYMVEITTPATHTVEAVQRIAKGSRIKSADELVMGGTSLETRAFKLYPIPVVDDVLNYSIDLKDGESIKSVEAIDMLGKSIISNNANAINQNQIHLDSNTPAGSYYMQIRTDKGQYMQKFSVIK